MKITFFFTLFYIITGTVTLFGRPATIVRSLLNSVVQFDTVYDFENTGMVSFLSNSFTWNELEDANKFVIDVY